MYALYVWLRPAFIPIGRITSQHNVTMMLIWLAPIIAALLPPIWSVGIAALISVVCTIWQSASAADNFQKARYWLSANESNPIIDMQKHTFKPMWILIPQYLILNGRTFWEYFTAPYEAIDALMWVNGLTFGYFLIVIFYWTIRLNEIRFKITAGLKARAE